MALMHAVEFVYGNGWTTGDIYGRYPWGNNAAILIWQTWRNGTLVSSGSPTIKTCQRSIGDQEGTRA